MDRDELIKQITDIGTIEDDAERRSKLTELTDNINNIFDTNEKLTKDYNDIVEKNKQIEEEKKQITADNDKLRDYNMQLFLRVGNEKTNDNNQTPNSDGAEGDEKKRDFKDLFNEKGGLK